MKQLELFDAYEENHSQISIDPYNRINLGNRKFLGSKQKLLNFIERSVLDRVPAIKTFCDGFAGTGVVANRFGSHARHLITNDILYSNFVVNKAFLNSTAHTVSIEKISQILHDLNNVAPRRGYVFNNYGGTYFTLENAALIDAIREEIELSFRNGECTEQEYYILLSSLLFAVDKVANTVGQYDAFLKHLGKDSYDQTGRHVLDSNVSKRMLLRLPNLRFDGRNDVYNEDLNKLIARITGDVLYLDPPYNTRQYIDCYHVLENIMRWEKPQLFGKTKKFARDHLKSRFSMRTEASRALSELIRMADFRYIFLSYNNEGIISKDCINAILKNRGSVEILEESYRIFGNGAGRSVKRPITERLFYCKVTSPPHRI